MSGFRRWLPLEREYALRDRLVRAEVDPAAPVAIHVAGWKTASQWVRLVLSDPVVLRRSQRRVTYVRGRTGDSGLRAEHLRPGHVLTPVYADADEPLLRRATDGEDGPAVRIAVVARRPVDLARSWFRANLIGHPSNPDVARRRAAMEAAGPDPLDRFHVLASEPDFAEAIAIGPSWEARAAVDPAVLVIPFEQLTEPGGAGRRAWLRVFDHLGLESSTLDGALARYRRDRLARVEAVLRPSAERKYGAVAPTGPWDELDDDDLLAAIAAIGTIEGVGR